MAPFPRIKNLVRGEGVGECGGGSKPGSGTGGGGGSPKEGDLEEISKGAGVEGVGLGLDFSVRLEDDHQLHLLRRAQPGTRPPRGGGVEVCGGKKERGGGN